jgi:hypothetical protein
MSEEDSPNTALEYIQHFFPKNADGLLQKSFLLQKS